MQLISYTDLANIVSMYGSKEDSERGPVTEVIGPQIFFTPGLLINRKGMNRRLAMLEAAMFCGGIFDIERIKSVAPKANHELYKYQSDYGPRTIGQLKYVIDELNGNKSSRKAVLNFQSINSPHPKVSSNGYFADMACTTSMQFLVRDNALMSITTMRSCDLVYGFPMDIFMFGMMTQFVSLCLGGITKISSCVQIGSLHIYSETDTLATEERKPEFVSLIKHSKLNDESNSSWSDSPLMRYHFMKKLFHDVVYDGALDSPQKWEDYKQICAWPFDFSTLSSDTQLEIS